MQGRGEVDPLAVLQWLQSVMQGSFWDTFWFLASKLYSEEFFLVLLPVLFWVGSRSFARYFAALFLFQIWLNVFLKGLAGTSRPPADAGLRIMVVDTEGGYGLPSGHAQGSAALFTTLARAVRRPWFTVLTVLAILLVGVARLYLGLHWPTDVLAGWAVGLALAFVWAGAWPFLSLGTERVPFGLRVGLAFALPALMLLLWESLPFVAAVGLGDQYTALGALTGMWGGTLLEERYVGFKPRGPLPRQVLQCLLGLAVLLAVRVGLKAVLPAGDWFTFVRYAAVGLAVTVALPWLFTRLPGGAPQRRAA